MKLISQELIDAIERERQRQEQKFPGQKLPAAWAEDGDHLPRADRACLMAGVKPEYQIKADAKLRELSGKITWADVLVEEVSEAISAAGRGDVDHACQELIEVAAVAIRFHDALRRGECGL